MARGDTSGVPLLCETEGATCCGALAGVMKMFSPSSEMKKPQMSLSSLLQSRSRTLESQGGSIVRASSDPQLAKVEGAVALVSPPNPSLLQCLEQRSGDWDLQRLLEVKTRQSQYEPKYLTA